MKKFIIGFIAGAITFVIISVGATILYYSSEIEYKGDTLEHAIDNLYNKTDTYEVRAISAYTANSGATLYNGVTLPDLTNYSKIKVGSYNLNGSIFYELKLRKGGTDYCTFQNVNGEQECDISSLSGDGYYLFCYIYNASLGKGTEISNIRLIR